MDIKTIGVEEWLNVWEKSATWDIAQSTISSLTMGELRALDEQDGTTFYERLDREKMNYGWIEGSPEFKAEVVSVNIFFTIFTNVFSPIAPTRMRRIRQRGCAAFGV